MMDHADDCDGDCEEEGVLEARFSWWDIAIAFFGFLAGIGSAFSQSAEYMLKTSAAASNRHARQVDFAEAVSASLESIPVTEDSDG